MLIIPRLLGGFNNYWLYYICTIHQVFSDQGGRYVAVLLDIFQHKMLLVNVYLPPPISVQLLYDLFAELAPFAHLPLILMVN